VEVAEPDGCQGHDGEVQGVEGRSVGSSPLAPTRPGSSSNSPVIAAAQPRVSASIVRTQFSIVVQLGLRWMPRTSSVRRSAWSARSRSGIPERGTAAQRCAGRTGTWTRSPPSGADRPLSERSTSALAWSGLASAGHGQRGDGALGGAARHRPASDAPRRNRLR
jgi:hypothetical protein